MIRAVGAAWAALTTPALPAWAALTAAHPRWRRDWRARWGLDLPPVAPGVVWVHAASVGEVAAAAALVPHLDRVLLTTDTDTGLDAARRIPGVVAAIRPVDHPATLAPLWADARPRLLVWVEGAWWPALAALAAGQGTPMVRVGARPATGTRRWGRLARVDLATCPTDDATAWFRAQGIPAVTTGDLKTDRPPPPNPLRWTRPFVVGASTRPGDEAALLAAVATLDPRPALLLAPRHLARVADLPGVRRSSLPDAPIDADVVVLDTHGELFGCLAGAAAAFVGGTFDAEIGGHSPAEAAIQGVPLVRGPCAHANPWPSAEVAATASDLAAALHRALHGPRPPPAAPGAGRRTHDAIAPLAGPPAPERAPRPWLAPLAALRPRPPARRSLDVPVIAVGSANARGGGKTSTARWAAARLRSAGHRVGVAVRGYRRATPGRDVRVGTEASDLGDEGALFARDGHLVAAGPDWLAACRALIDAGASAVVLDDGLRAPIVPHVALHVVDARFPTAGGPIPAGWGRRVDLDGPRIVHHADDPAATPISGAHATRLSGPWHRGLHSVSPPNGPVALFCGVARAGDVDLGVPAARTRVLRDHQPIDDALAAELLGWAGDLPLACTAKDHVRLPPALAARVWWRDLLVEVPDADPSWFPPPRG